jgi:hypothetical protein
MSRWLLALVALALAGCGLGVQSPDLFVMTRTGQTSKLTLLVNDGGTIRCDGSKARPLPDPLLLKARDLASALDGDAKHNLKIPSPPNSVYRYTIQLQDGKVAFPDTVAAGGRFPNLAQAELFAVQAAQQACGLGG